MKPICSIKECEIVSRFKGFCIRHYRQQHLPPLYNTWLGMVQRCTNPKAINYKYYGGRGITLCDRWLDINNFIADMGGRPAGTTLDRRDNSKGYNPDNCRWATPVEQANNRRKRNMK